MAIDYNKLSQIYRETGRKILNGEDVKLPDINSMIHTTQVKTEYIKGSPERVDLKMNEFYTYMMNKFPDSFRVISVNTVSIPEGEAVHITYSYID